MKKYVVWFCELWSHNWKKLGGIFLLTVVTILAKTIYPIFLKHIIDQLSGQFVAADVIKLVGGLLLFAIVHELLSNLLPTARGIMNMIQTAMIRNRYYQEIMRKGADFFMHFRTGDLLTRFTDDIDGAWDRLAWYSCSGIFRPIEAILILIFTLSFMFYYSAKLTIFSFFPIPFLILILAAVETRIMKYTDEKQRSISACNNFLEASLSGVKVVQICQSEGHQLERYQTILSDRIQREKDFLKLNQVIFFFSMLVNHLGKIIVIFVGSYLVLKKELTIGTLILFLIYLERLVEPIWTLSWFYASTKQVVRYVQRLMDIGEYPVPPQQGIQTLTEPFKTLCVENVNFSYPDNHQFQLRNISLTLRRGETVAIVGTIGAGKTTLLDLLAGNLTPNAGRIQINEHDLVSLAPETLTNLIGYVHQKNLLFSSTIEENLQLGQTFTTTQLQQALQNGRIWDEVSAMSAGIKTDLGQGGMNLSGGQKQRISLARTLLRRPQLLLLDDVTAALDTQNEQTFWAQMEREFKDHTWLIVTHRLATAQRAGRILVLHRGEIVETGTHAELWARPSLYRKIMGSELRSPVA